MSNGPFHRERRRLLADGGAAALAATMTIATSSHARAATPPAAAADADARATDAGPTPPDLSFLQTTPLCDGDRLRRLMQAQGLDALVVSHPANVFYLTNHWPQLDRMGFEGSGIAVFALDAARPVALVMHAFLYYYTHTPESRFDDRLVFTYTQPADARTADGIAEPAAQPARTMRSADPALVTDRDRHRSAMFALARSNSADASWALQKAVAALQLNGKAVGIDDAAVGDALRLRGFDGTLRPGENLIRRARLAKSPAELKLMRFAAQANVDAAMAAAVQARTLGTARRLRAEFYAQAARRGNIGHFMVISGVSSEALDQPLADGSAVSIDCVSTCRFYHGDFGRTIFVGEPPAPAVRAASAVATAWGEIREQLRPGMQFADIPRIGRAVLARLGTDISVGFTPHSVGLFHTDHPQPSLVSPRGPDDLVLEENMVLSVDCPVFTAGLGGTVHLEDLMLIRNGRAEALHSTPPNIIAV